jgi:hypothetical protein
LIVVGKPIATVSTSSPGFSARSPSLILVSPLRATKFALDPELTNSALDLLTRAKTQCALAAKEIKDEHEAEENNMVKTLFPLKRGDTDADKKIKGSGLIYAIQSALVNGIPSAGKLIKSKGGPNGKYGPATSAVISTIQKLEGNKNTNGELDKTLLDDILSSDWVAEKDKKAIEKSLQVVRVKVNESFSSVMSISDFSNSLNEGKIVIECKYDEFSKFDNKNNSSYTENYKIFNKKFCWSFGQK